MNIIKCKFYNKLSILYKKDYVLKEQNKENAALFCTMQYIYMYITTFCLQ